MSDVTAPSDRFQRAIEDSAIVGAASRVVRQSRFATVSERSRRIEEAVGRSGVRRCLDRFDSGMGDAMAAATVVTVASTIARFARASFLYRWLTAEPEPDVVVIDLRETVTVGPVVAAMDVALQHLDAWLPSSVVAGAVTDAIEATRAAPIRVASTVALAAATTAFLATLATDTASAGSFLAYASVLVLSLLGYRDTRSWDEVRETRPAELLVALLEPPEPPEPHGNGAGDDRTPANRDGPEE